MKLISYEQFAGLRMSQFWGPDASIEGISLLECGLGMGDGETIGWSYFLWPAEHPGEVSEIRLEAFPHELCPGDVANRIFQQLGIPLLVGSNEQSVIEQLGSPYARTQIGDVKNLEFKIQDYGKYLISCGFTNEGGLGYFTIIRQDRAKT